MKLRIGKINFLNLYPIYYTLEKGCDPSRFEFIEGAPAELNGLLNGCLGEVVRADGSLRHYYLSGQFAYCWIRFNQNESRLVRRKPTK